MAMAGALQKGWQEALAWVVISKGKKETAFSNGLFLVTFFV